MRLDSATLARVLPASSDPQVVRWAPGVTARAIATLLDEGHSIGDVAASLGFSVSHTRNLARVWRGLGPKARKVLLAQGFAARVWDTWLPLSKLRPAYQDDALKSMGLR